MVNKEISVGAFLYKKQKDEILFLLVYSKRNKEWGFPKGHIEKGETELETAKREIEEETGITEIVFDKTFRCSDTYKIKGTFPETSGRIVEKNVIYYLGETDCDFKKSGDDEIERGKWFKYEQAVRCLKYEKQKDLLEKAYIFLKEEKL